MISFQNLDDLYEFGVHYLTSEGCGLSMRGLFDLNYEGCQLIQSFMGVDIESLPNGHNRGIKSIMLPFSMMKDLWIFAAVKAGYKYVFVGGWNNPSNMIEEVYPVFETGSDEPKFESIYKPPKDWHSQPYATNDEERMTIIKDYIATRHFYVKRWYKKTSHPGDGLNNTKAM